MSGTAADPDGVLYVNINEIPWFYQMIPTTDENGNPLPPGERHYITRCAACHGLDLAGDPGSGFPSLVDIRSRLTREAVMQVVTQGGGRMPAFDGLSEEQRQAIVGYLLGEAVPVAHDDSDDAGTTPPYAFRGFHRFFDDEGYPAIKPPWGTLNAVDLNTGEIKWAVPLGEYPELTARGIEPTGTENYGGPVVTAGGLLFIGATADGKIRAFDKETGEMLWEHDLPRDGNATPSTYMVDGKQYAVISAGGAKTNRPKGGSLVAFALPD